MKTLLFLPDRMHPRRKVAGGTDHNENCWIRPSLALRPVFVYHHAMIAAFNTVLLALVLVFAYAWVGYPILLAVAARRATSRKAPPSLPPPEELPRLYVVLAAYNEENVIAERIRNLQSVDYPAEKLTILLGIDGSTDGTATVARSAAEGDTRIHVLDFAENCGKVAVLRDLVAGIVPEQEAPHLLLFTDANTMFAHNALLKLVRHFDDPLIGGVCGRLALTDAGSTSENPAEEGAYWRLETKLKTWESSLDSCLGANGAIYAVRPELFWQEIPTNTIVDDFVIGMKIREQGFRVCYDPEAVATEELPAISDEWVRRVRIGAGDYQAAVLCRTCLLPRFGAFAWFFWSHKILRWLTPHMAILMAVISYPLAATAWLRGLPLSSALLAYAVAVGLAALLVAGRVGVLLRSRGRTGRLAHLCAMCDHFTTMHAALMAGSIRFLGGNMSGAWKRTPRG